MPCSRRIALSWSLSCPAPSGDSAERRAWEPNVPPENSFDARSLHDDRVLGMTPAGDLVAGVGLDDRRRGGEDEPRTELGALRTRAPPTIMQREPMKQSSSTTTGRFRAVRALPDADAARQVHVLADLRRRCDGRPRVDQRAAVDVGADVDVQGISTTPRARNDPNRADAPGTTRTPARLVAVLQRQLSTYSNGPASMTACPGRGTNMRIRVFGRLVDDDLAVDDFRRRGSHRGRAWL